MTEPDAPDPIHPIPAEPPERVRVDGPPPRRRRDPLPLLYVLGFLVLAGSLFYLYRNPSMPAGVVQEAARVDTLQQQIESLTGRLTELEQRPAPPPLPAPSIAPLEARIAALEPRISGLEQRPAPATPPPPDFGPLITRFDASLSKQAADLTARLDAGLSKQEAGLSKQVADLTARLDAGLSKQEAGLSKQAAELQSLTARLNTVEGRLTAVEQQDSAITGQISGITERAQRTSRIQTATAALEAGQKLGEIPGAPPAVARFAYNAPPTEAALRLSYDSAAEAAQRASQPAIMEDKPFAARLWTRAQQSVSVRQGDRVLLGDPVAGVLAHARQALEAGDLAGAVAALDGLPGPAAAAMADWIGQARALLEARKALATMAARG